MEHLFRFTFVHISGISTCNIACLDFSILNKHVTSAKLFNLPFGTPEVKRERPKILNVLTRYPLVTGIVQVCNGITIIMYNYR